MTNHTHSRNERKELQKIKAWFPEARLKDDYNREILDIGAEIPFGDETLILLKGPQTNEQYELVTPECRCLEGLKSMEEVNEIYRQLLRAKAVITTSNSIAKSKE